MNAPNHPRGIQVFTDFEQGSIEWFQARCGMLTASEFDKILTPTLKIAANAKERAHLWELAAQRISGYVEPSYISDAMLRGHEDEFKARELYSKHYEPVAQCGFITNDKWGFTLGCSPDGLVGDEGMIEVKSRCQKYQVQTVCEYHASGLTPEDFSLQIQGEMLITGRKWCDLISYSAGLPMATMRVEPDLAVQEAILDAAAKFESRINAVVVEWHETLANGGRFIPTERLESEMFI